MNGPAPVTLQPRESHGTHIARNIAVSLLTAAIVALGTAVIMHGRDLVELRVKVESLEHRLDNLTK